MSNWSATLAQLRLQMTEATYNALLARSQADAPVASALTIHVESDTARQWLEARLTGTVERAVARVYGQALRVRFVNGAGPAESVVEVEAEPEPVGQAEIEPAALNSALVDLIRTWTKKFVKHPRQVSLFWQNYFSRRYRFAGAMAVPTWLWLRDQYDTNQGERGWTPVREYWLKDLASMVNCPIQKMTGVVRMCPVYRKALKDARPLSACCGRYRGARLVISEDSGGRCDYRVAGVIEALIREGWLAFRKLGTASRNTHYHLQAYRYPPLLTPAQFEVLTPANQKHFTAFLDGELHISLDEWRAVEIESFMDAWFERSGLSLESAPGAVLNVFTRKDIFLNHF